jgi:hypothetical protein
MTTVGRMDGAVEGNVCWLPKVVIRPVTAFSIAGRIIWICHRVRGRKRQYSGLGRAGRVYQLSAVPPQLIEIIAIIRIALPTLPDSQLIF